jgi:hypothetical protein
VGQQGVAVAVRQPGQRVGHRDALLATEDRVLGPLDRQHVDDPVQVAVRRVHLAPGRRDDVARRRDRVRDERRGLDPFPRCEHPGQRLLHQVVHEVAIAHS